MSEVAAAFHDSPVPSDNDHYVARYYLPYIARKIRQHWVGRFSRLSVPHGFLDIGP
jgi:hypothetical protein